MIHSMIHSLTHGVGSSTTESNAQNINLFGSDPCYSGDGHKWHDSGLRRMASRCIAWGRYAEAGNETKRNETKPSHTIYQHRYDIALGWCSIVDGWMHACMHAIEKERSDVR
mmetsp:Transcript_4837/g.13988  ORF Transcript_4837/g.13988 Transcript_4837/m.13988 type:complete len:112 (+) Transcript_4837:29-364(+)